MSAAKGEPGAVGLEEVLERIRSEKRMGIMTHVVLGYPTLEASRQLVHTMIRSGVDLIEIQLPFSDPTADGPVITQACHRSLERGTKVADGMRLISEVSRQGGAAILIMSYFNLLFRYRGGVGAFAKDAAAAGASGLIVPDIPPEEDHEGYSGACRSSGLHPIYVVSPNIGSERLEAVRKVASGFLYSTSRTGTTGKEAAIEMGELGKFLERARRICGLPLAVGFGISRRDQVEALRGKAEIAVVGSHLIRVYDKLGLAGFEREVRNLTGCK